MAKAKKPKISENIEYMYTALVESREKKNYKEGDIVKLACNFGKLDEGREIQIIKVFNGGAVFEGIAIGRVQFGLNESNKRTYYAKFFKDVDSEGKEIPPQILKIPAYCLE